MNSVVVYNKIFIVIMIDVFSIFFLCSWCLKILIVLLFFVKVYSDNILIVNVVVCILFLIEFGDVFINISIFINKSVGCDNLCIFIVVSLLFCVVIDWNNV